LRLDRDPLWLAEYCELVEQIKHSFLPLFTTRNVDYHSNCVAHQVSRGGTWLQPRFSRWIRRTTRSLSLLGKTHQAGRCEALCTN
jgi:hypothetical protein